MRIIIHVKPRSSQQSVTRQDDGSFIVCVHSAPTGGQANKEAVKVISEYFSVAKSCVRIVVGKTTRTKMIEIQ